MIGINQPSQTVRPNNTLNFGASEAVANCDRFNMLINLQSQLAASSNISLRSQFATLKPGRGKHREDLPYVFTEQGVSLKDLGRKWFAFSKFDKEVVAILGRLENE